MIEAIASLDRAWGRAAKVTRLACRTRRLGDRACGRRRRSCSIALAPLARPSTSASSAIAATSTSISTTTSARFGARSSDSSSMVKSGRAGDRSRRNPAASCGSFKRRDLGAEASAKAAQMRDQFDLSGRTAIVTGGGGILGQGFCEVLAAHGANVAVFDVDDKAAARTVDAIKTASPSAKVIAVPCDVSIRGIGRKRRGAGRQGVRRHRHPAQQRRDEDRRSGAGSSRRSRTTRSRPGARSWASTSTACS